jgi:exonuclease III
MLDTGGNMGMDANVKYSWLKKDRNHYKVNQFNKGKTYLKIFQQNITGLARKTGKLVSHLHPNYPQVLCLTEHHLNDLQLEKIHIENYKLGANYCRQIRAKGGVAIFVHNNLEFTNIDIDQHCTEQDIEICALKLVLGTMNICIITL